MRPHSIVVIAESDFLTGTLLVAALEAEGHRALIARDGETVLQLIDTHNPAALVLSMNLARPGGVQMLRKLRQKQTTLNIVATVRIGQANLRAAARALGVSSFLEIPFSPADFGEQVRRILAS